MNESAQRPLLAIHTLVYNHAPFLHDYFRGILMQETTFPFVAIVHDDASTDGSADIIREYAEKYPDIIKPIYETENQYSQRDGSLMRIMIAATKGYKYCATCEGDDYWTDPHKLQKQVDFLEAHPEYSMVCCNGVIQTPTEKLANAEDYQKINWPYKEGNGDCTLEELVTYGGRYMLTAGLVYRNGLREKYPPECKNLPCGDYVLKLFAALTGKVYYFADSMIVYRHQSSPNSWSHKALKKRINHLKDIAWKHDVHLLAAADRFSHYEHQALFRKTILQYVKYFLVTYPHIRHEIIQEMGFALEYSYHAPYWHKEDPEFLRRLRFHSMVLSTHPWFPKGLRAYLQRRFKR